MSENIESPFLPLLRKTGENEALINTLDKKFMEAFELITAHNDSVAQIQASKAQDPNDTTHLDATWKRIAEGRGNAEIVELEAKYQELVAAEEEIVKQLRALAKPHIKPPLSEEAAKALRNQINQGSDAVNEARKAAAVMAELANQMFDLKGVNIKGGIMSLMPKIESLKNVRGKGAKTGGSTGSYMTRVNDVIIDGKSTQKDKKGKFNYAAEYLSALWNASRIAANEVTAEELEEAFFKHLGVPFRSMKFGEIPDESTFDFTRIVKKQNPNDEGTTDAPETVKITVLKWKAPAEEAPKTEETEKATEATGATEPGSVKTGPATQKLIDQKAAQDAAKKATPQKK